MSKINIKCICRYAAGGERMNEVNEVTKYTNKSVMDLIYSNTNTNSRNKINIFNQLIPNRRFGDDG